MYEREREQKAGGQHQGAGQSVWPISLRSKRTAVSDACFSTFSSLLLSYASSCLTSLPSTSRLSNTLHMRA